MASDNHRQSRQRALRAALADRILILDGAMGTMIQSRRLSEPDYRGERLRDHPRDLKGNNDILNLSRPDVIRDIHDGFLAVGADILETNTFNATSISQADYGTEDLVPEINREGARIARAAADAAATPERPRFVAGALGPTNRTASISPDVNDPGYRNTSFDELRAAYRQAAEALVAGGVDLLLLETVFDTLNAKAALFALDELFEAQGFALPVMVSGTITDRSGRTLSGQTVEAFWNSVRHAQPFTVGLNCALGPDLLRAHVAEMARVAEAPVCAYPNAGLPNEMGEYEETPAHMAAHIGEWARAGLLNVVGGCCGTTPEHIGAIARAVEGVPPRAIPHRPKALRLAGLEAFTVSA